MGAAVIIPLLIGGTVSAIKACNSEHEVKVSLPPNASYRYKFEDCGKSDCRRSGSYKGERPNFGTL